MDLRLAKDNECHSIKKIQKATDKLFDRLKEHHDYNVPFQFVTKVEVEEIRTEIIEIKTEPEIALPVDICVLPISECKLTVDSIKRIVCKHFGITHNELISPRRDHKVQRPRMVAMYLAREYTPHGLPALGRYFHRDHTSVLHSVRKAEGIIAAGLEPIIHDISYLKEMLAL